MTEEYFTDECLRGDISTDRLKAALCIVVKAAYWRRDYLKMYRFALKDVADNPSSEMCFLLGSYYEDMGELDEAAIWYYNAAFECHSILNIRYEKEYPLQGLVDVYNSLGMPDTAAEYENILNDYLGEE